jgi:hypothetical protein
MLVMPPSWIWTLRRVIWGGHPSHCAVAGAGKECAADGWRTIAARAIDNFVIIIDGLCWYVIGSILDDT